jgi:hypothetical protein
MRSESGYLGSELFFAQGTVMNIKPPHHHTQAYWDHRLIKYQNNPQKVAYLRAEQAREAAYWGGVATAGQQGKSVAQLKLAPSATGLSSLHNDPAAATSPGAASQFVRRQLGSGAPAASKQALFATANPSVPYSLTDQGPALAGNKATVLQALSQLGATTSEQAVVMAIAMQETTHMDVSQRDAGKDGTPAANVSAFNLNVDMVAQLGFKGNTQSLNDQGNIGTAVGLLVKAMRTWGTKRLLDFQRGGRTGFEDGVSYGCASYRNAIGTSYNLIMADPTLLTDSRRVTISVAHV